jgi:hypothetical protein
VDFCCGADSEFRQLTISRPWSTPRSTELPSAGRGAGAHAAVPSAEIRCAGGGQWNFTGRPSSPSSGVHFAGLSSAIWRTSAGVVVWEKFAGIRCASAKVWGSLERSECSALSQSAAVSLSHAGPARHAAALVTRIRPPTSACVCQTGRHATAWVTRIQAPPLCRP